MVFDFLKGNKPEIRVLGLDEFLECEEIPDREKLPILLKAMDDCGDLEEFKEFIRNSHNDEYTDVAIQFIEKVQQCNHFARLCSNGVMTVKQAQWQLAKEFTQDIIVKCTGGQVQLIDDFKVRIVLDHEDGFNFSVNGLNNALQHQGMYIENLCIKNDVLFDSIIVHLEIGMREEDLLLKEVEI